MKDNDLYDQRSLEAGMDTCLAVGITMGIMGTVGLISLFYLGKTAYVGIRQLRKDKK